MKTKIELLGFEIEIEERDGKLSVVVEKDGEEIEDIILDPSEYGEDDEDQDEDRDEDDQEDDEDIKDFDQFENEDEEENDTEELPKKESFVTFESWLDNRKECNCEDCDCEGDCDCGEEGEDCKCK